MRASCIINKMRHYIRLLLIMLALCVSGTGWAAAQLVIQFSGVEGKVNENVKMALVNLRGSIVKNVTDASVQEFFKKAPQEIRGAVEPFGYFDSNIKASLTRNNNIWTADFKITPGTPVHIVEVDLDLIGPGNKDPILNRVRTYFPLKIGQILNTANYETSKQLLFDLASTRGYFDAKMLLNKIYINLKTHQAKIVFKFQTGRRYFFGKTDFSNTAFSPRFLHKFLAYKYGELYNYAHLQKTQQALLNSNYFSEVIVSPNHKAAVNYYTPIDISLKLRKRYAYTFGLGFGTDTGPRGSLGFTVRRVNKYGHRFSTLLQGAKNDTNLTATYYIPGTNPVTDLWTFSAGYSDFNQVTGNGTSRRATVGYATSIGEWQQTIALTYLNERYNIVTFPFTKTTLVYPSMKWSYVNTENIINPKFGFRFSGTVAGTLKSAISETSFTQIRVHAKVVSTLFKKNTRLVLRTTLARTNISNLENLPFSLQLFAGGARSIRGYRFNAIGPGRNMFVGSVELQQRIYGDWYLAAFYDVGNVTSDNPFDTRTLFQGVGPGIVWLSPIGALEITVANAISQQGRPWVIQFTMGPEL